MNKVIFTGSITENASISIIREKLKAQFKLPDAHLDKVFSGKPFVLKSTPDIEQAKKLHDWLTQIGMVCQLSLADVDLNIDLDPIRTEETERPATESTARGSTPNVTDIQNKLVILGKLLLQFPSIKTFTILLSTLAIIQLAIGPIRSNTLGPLLVGIDAIAVLVMTLASFTIMVSAMYRDATIKDVFGFLLNTGKTLLHTPEPSLMMAGAIAHLNQLPIKIILATYIKYSLWGFTIAALIVVSGDIFKQSGSEAAYYTLVVLAIVVGFTLGNWIPPYQSVAKFIPGQRLPIRPFMLVSLIQTIAFVTISALLIQTVANDDARLAFAVAAIVAWGIYVLVITRFAWGLANRPVINGEPIPIRKYYSIATAIAIGLVVVASATWSRQSKQQDIPQTQEVSSTPAAGPALAIDAHEMPSTSSLAATEWDICSEKAASSADPGYGRAGVESAINEQCGEAPKPPVKKMSSIAEAIGESGYDIVRSKHWMPKFTAITGDKYELFLEGLSSYQEPARLENGWIVAEGCQEGHGRCIITASVFAINTETEAVFGAMLDGGDLIGFGFDSLENAPPYIQSWVQERQ